jgi:hypothetical protein
MKINFIRREAVLELLDRFAVPEKLREAIAGIPSFPDPNPLELNGCNIMGQTEDQF